MILLAGRCGDIAVPNLVRCSLILLLSLALAACGGGTTPDANPTAPAATQPPPVVNTPVVIPTDPSGQPVVAIVNGQSITQSTFERAVARRQAELNAATPEALRAEVLNQLIEQILIEQGAQLLNISISDEQLQAEIQSNKELAGSDQAWTDWLNANQYTPEEFAASLRTTLVTNLVRDQLTADLAGIVRQVHARHILLRTEQDAKDTLARLQAGEDFAALAGALSQDEVTRAQGGDLGWFTADELLVPTLAQAAFALQPGQIAGPVPTELGYHVIQTIEFAEREVDLERRVSIAQARFENWLRPLVDNAVIQQYMSF